MSTVRSLSLLAQQDSLGAQADSILDVIGNLHAEREAAAVTELITWFRSEPWDERTAIRYVAALSENRAQKEELEYRSRKGSDARKKLFENPATAE